MGFSSAFGSASHQVARGPRARRVVAVAVVALAVVSGCQGGGAAAPEESAPSGTGVPQDSLQNAIPESNASEEALAEYVQKVADLYEERLRGLEIQGVDEFINAIRLAPTNRSEAAITLTGLGVTQKSFEINDALYEEACKDQNLVRTYESLEVFCPNQLSIHFKSNGVVELLPADFDYADINPTNISTVPLLLGFPTNMDVKQKSDVPSLVESLVFRHMNDIGEISNTDLTAANAPQEMGIENWLNALLARLAEVNHENSPVVRGMSDPVQKKAWGEQYPKIVRGALTLVE